MKILYIGCRVRAIGTWEGFLTSEDCNVGTITKKDVKGGHSGKQYEWGVRLDNGFPLCANSDELEPLLDLSKELEAEEKELELA